MKAANSSTLIERGRKRCALPALHTLTLGLLLSAMSTLPAAAQGRAANLATLKVLHSNHADLRADYFEKLQKLKGYCQDHQLADGVAEITRYQTPPDKTRIQVSTLPTIVQPEIPLDLAPEARQWLSQLRVHRQEYARQLYLLSRRALHAGSPGYAFDLIHELVVHDPDHAKARELLGYVRLGDEWLTPFAKKMRLKGYEWQPQFGWLPKNFVERYVAGERNVDGKWMTADKEAAIRQDFQHAWEIQTDHYLIRTNYSLERGAELGRALEDFYEFFHQTFAGFFNEPEQLQKLFNGGAPGGSRHPKQYLVHYYRTREEYVERLQPLFPAIQATNGIYLTGDRTAHFYYDPKGTAEDTLFHEATHQLFYESHLMHRPIAESANFWIVEGIACYLESFRRQDGSFSVGDPGHIRFAGARMNFIDKTYYVPLREFVEMGGARFQAAPVEVLAKNYTQAAGIAHFFMQYDDGRYRDAVVSHLAQVYSSDSRKRQYTQGLDELTGVDYDELDRQYGEWLKELRGADVARLAAPATPSNMP